MDKNLSFNYYFIFTLNGVGIWWNFNCIPTKFLSFYWDLPRLYPLCLDLGEKCWGQDKVLQQCRIEMSKKWIYHTNPGH